MSLLKFLQGVEKLPAEIVSAVEKEINNVEAIVKKDAPEIKALLAALVKVYNAAKAATPQVTATIQALESLIAQIVAFTIA